METLVGSTLGGYMLTRVIGGGGMGTVYLAEDKAIGQQVAIKVVRTDNSEYTDLMSTKQVAERFKQEARAVANLDHLNILPLYRYGEEATPDGIRSYMVMQYRPEGSLWGWLRKRAEIIAQTETSASDMVELPPGLPADWPLQKEEVTDYINQAAAALQYAHDRGFIHRDVKPENFLLRFDKTPTDTGYKAFLLLSDFGLVKFFSNLSGTSQVLGTPTYMAPEQFDGLVRPESDQYALAIMAYCLLAGQPPFIGDPIRLMHQHLTAPPPSILSFVPTLPTQTKAVLDKALAKKPSERYPSITDFANAFMQSIHEGQKTEPRTAHSAPTSKPHFSIPSYAQQNPSQWVPDLFAPWQTQNASPQERSHTAIPTANYPIQTQLNSNQHKNEQANNFAFDAYPSHNSYRVLQEPQTPPATTLQESVASQHNLSAQPLTLPISGQRALPNQKTLPANNAASLQWQNSNEFNQPQPQTEKQSLTRRTITKLIIGGVAAVGIGAGATSLYLANHKNKLLQINQNTMPQTSQNALPNTVQPTSPNIKHILRGHTLAVNSLVWSPDGTKLASGSLDRTIRLWDTGQLNTPLIIKNHKVGVLTVSWRPDSTQLASGSKDNSIQTYSTADGSVDQTFTSDDGIGVISKIAWSQNGEDLFVSTLEDGLQEISLGDHNIKQRGTKATYRSLALSPDGNYLALGSDNGTIAILTLPELRHPLVNHIHEGSVRALAWSPDSTLLASGGVDKTIQIFNRETKTIVYSLTNDSIVNDLAWKPAQTLGTQGTQQIAAALADGTMQIWTSGSNIHTIYKGHTGAVTSISWGQQGLATASLDKTIIIWNV